MKIAIVAPSAENANGIGIYTNNMIAGLSAVSQISLFEVVDSDLKRLQNGTCSIRKDFLCDYEHAALLINETYDICILHHSFSAYGWQNSGLALVLAKCLTIPLGVVFHQVDINPSDKCIKIGIALGKIATFGMVMSQQAANIIEHLFKIPTEKIKVLPYGISNIEKIGKEVAKQKFGLSQKTVILSFGLLKPSKGIEAMLEALAMLKTKQNPWVFIHIGQTEGVEKMHHGEAYRKKLTVLARHLKIEERICFIDHYVSDAILFEYLQAADLTLFNALDESRMQSATMQLALSAGVPILSAPFLLASELLSDNLGEIYSFSDAQLLSLKISGMLQNPRQMSIYQQAASDFGANFMWKRLSMKYLSHFDDVINKFRVDNKRVLSSEGHFFEGCTNQNQSLLQATLNDSQLCWWIISKSIVSSNQLVTENRDALVAMANFLEHNKSNEPNSLAYYTLGLWIKANGTSSLKTAATSLFISWTQKLLNQNIENNYDLALYLLGLCEYRSVNDDISLITLLRNLHKQLSSWLNGSHGNWPEDTFTAYPALKVYALLRASHLLNADLDFSAAVDKANFVLDKSFNEGVLITLTGREFPFVKFKRTDFIQNGEEVLWTIALCNYLAYRTDDKLILAKAWQSFMWYLGENNIRKSLIDDSCGIVALSIDGLNVNPNIMNHGSLLYDTVVSVAKEVYMQKLVLNYT